MKKTLQKINDLVSLGIIENYAIVGGIAHFYYIEPSVTYDLDLVVNIKNIENTLTPLESIYKWAANNKYETEQEHIVIEGIPVQFLLSYNNLIAEALDKRVEITLFNEKTNILSAEYLMAIMLQTGRASDKERLIRFLGEADFNESVFLDIITRYDLLNKFRDFKEKHYE